MVSQGGKPWGVDWGQFFIIDIWLHPYLIWLTMMQSMPKISPLSGFFTKKKGGNGRRARNMTYPLNRNLQQYLIVGNVGGDFFAGLLFRIDKSRLFQKTNIRRDILNVPM